MHQIQIHVVGTKVLQSLVQSRLHIFRGMLGIPELSGDEDIFSGYAGLANTLADLSLVAVDGCTVDVSVPFLQSTFDCTLDLFRCSLPCSEADGRDLGASVELEVCGELVVGVRHDESYFNVVEGDKIFIAYLQTYTLCMVRTSYTWRPSR